MEKRDVACGVIIRKNKQNDLPEVLLIQRSRNDHWPLRWECPRGGCNKGKDKESLEECLKREVKEESGLDVEIVEFIDKFFYVSHGEKKITIQNNYLCKIKDSNQKVKLSREHQDYKWLTSYGHIQFLVSSSEMSTTIMKALDMVTKGGINMSILDNRKTIKEIYGRTINTINNREQELMNEIGIIKRAWNSTANRVDKIYDKLTKTGEKFEKVAKPALTAWAIYQLIKKAYKHFDGPCRIPNMFDEKKRLQCRIDALEETLRYAQMSVPSCGSDWECTSAYRHEIGKLKEKIDKLKTKLKWVDVK